MPKPSAQFLAAIRNLSDKEKEKIIIRFARSYADMHDILAFELVDDVNIDTVREQTQEQISDLLFNITGRSFYKGLNRAIGKAAKEITRIKKITKSAQLEVDLYRFLLQVLFDNFSGQFENYNRTFPSKMARLTQKLHDLIVKNLHPDLRIEYKAEVNNWLDTLRNRAGSNLYVQKLPQELPE